MVVYPNPVNDHLFIKGGESIHLNTVAILNGMGQVVYEKSGIDLTTGILVSHLSSGVYLLTYEQAGVRRNLKFVKENE
jgi:hypothetical protein